MLSHYPIVYVEAVTNRVLDWDAFPIGREPNLFPGKEMSLQNGLRYQVERVFQTQISSTEPVMFVQMTPATKMGFISNEAVEAVKKIYAHLEEQAQLEEESDLPVEVVKLGNDMATKLASYPWN